MLRATNRSRDIVNQMLVLFPLAGFDRAHAISDDVAVRISGLEGLIESKAAKLFAMRIGAPVTQSVAFDRLAFFLQFESGRTSAFEHRLQKSFRRGGTVIISPERFGC